MKYGDGALKHSSMGECAVAIVDVEKMDSEDEPRASLEDVVEIDEIEFLRRRLEEERKLLRMRFGEREREMRWRLK